MKKQFLFLVLTTVFVSTVISLSSCKKEEDEGKLPNIAFKTGGAYTSANDTLPAGTAFTVGINASKAESADVLKTFNISKSWDGATAVTDTTITLTGADQDAYSQDFTRTTGAAGHTEKWSFTVTNRDGLQNTVDFTLTVQ